MGRRGAGLVFVFRGRPRGIWVFRLGIEMVVEMECVEKVDYEVGCVSARVEPGGAERKRLEEEQSY